MGRLAFSDDCRCICHDGQSVYDYEEMGCSMCCLEDEAERDMGRAEYLNDVLSLVGTSLRRDKWDTS